LRPDVGAENRRFVAAGNFVARKISHCHGSRRKLNVIICSWLQIAFCYLQNASLAIISFCKRDEFFFYSKCLGCFSEYATPLACCTRRTSYAFCCVTALFDVANFCARRAHTYHTHTQSVCRPIHLPHSADFERRTRSKR
jgi:hypothetical protein